VLASIPAVAIDQGRIQGDSSVLTSGCHPPDGETPPTDGLLNGLLQSRWCRGLVITQWHLHFDHQGNQYSLHDLTVSPIFSSQYNLDYPDFYRQLYALLEPSIFHVKHRSQFFLLLDLFMSSALLPSYLVAAFVKRLVRLLLTAPPAGCLFVLPFVFNLMCRHPACQALIHRQAEREGRPQPLLLLSTDTNSKLPEKLRAPLQDFPGFDPYDPSEPDPAKCKAIDSSLWEVEALRNHYEPTISRLVSILERDMKKTALFDINNFVDYSYQKVRLQFQFLFLIVDFIDDSVS